VSRKISQISRYVPAIVEITYPGLEPGVAPLRMHSLDGLDQVARVMWWEGWGRYEPPLPELFLACARTSEVILDIGAYTGFYAMLAARVNRDAKIVAFEPFPPVRGWFEQNLALNRLEKRVEVVPMAVGDQPGEATLYVPTTKTGLLETASSLNATFRVEHSETICVKVVRLDDFVRQQGLGRVGLMKIDVESFEAAVLRGAGRVLSQDRPMIFLEVLKAADVGGLEAIRREHGYLSGLLVPEGVRWQAEVCWAGAAREQILCPSERREEFEQIAASSGYNCT
jgi:FkbM family methyltransferase